MVKKLVVGAIGTGRIGKLHITALAQQFPDIHIKRVAEKMSTASISGSSITVR